MFLSFLEVRDQLGLGTASLQCTALVPQQPSSQLALWDSREGQEMHAIPGPTPTPKIQTSLMSRQNHRKTVRGLRYLYCGATTRLVRNILKPSAFHIEYKIYVTM